MGATMLFWILLGLAVLFFVGLFIGSLTAIAGRNDEHARRCMDDHDREDD